MSIARTLQDMRSGGAAATEVSSVALTSIAESLEKLASEAEPQVPEEPEVQQDQFTRELFAIMRAANNDGKDGLPVDVVAANLLARYEIRPRFVVALGGDGTGSYQGGMPAIAVQD